MEKQWFILRHIVSPSSALRNTAKEAVERFNKIESCSLELFAPTTTQVVKREGKFIKRKTPLTFQYVFVRGTLQEVKHLCGQTQRFAFLLNRTSTNPDARYATLTDAQLRVFQTVALAYSNSLPFLALDEIKLEEGDKVEIVEGAFPGLVGYYMPHAKSRSGDIVLAVSQNLGTVVYDIKAKYVRVLEFSKKSRRSYDQIDAFVPRLLAALRLYHERQPLPSKSLSDLHLFVRRMECAKISNPKIDSKLSALLSAAATIIGDAAVAKHAQKRLAARLDKVTSPSTLLLIRILQAVISGQMTLLTTEEVAEWAKSIEVSPSRADTIILEELQYYLSK